jgi:phosphohistidine phosphatase
METSMKHAAPKMSDSIPEPRMDLLLWRHAEAEDSTPDLKRKLTARGEKQAQQMAEWIKQHAPKNLRIIASPAVRCQQTAKALDLPFSTDKRLGPDAGVPDLLAAIDWPHGSAKERSAAVLVIGHQPTLGRTAALLLAGEEASWTIKKGAVWWFSNRVRQGETQTVLRAVMPPDSIR